MQKIILLLSIILITVSLYAQKQCGDADVDSATIMNLPWFANNTWLNNFVDSIEAPFNCTNCRLGDGPTKTLYQIPINAVVYSDVNYPNISDAQVEQYINYANNLYKNNGVLIHFYLRCAIKRMGNSNHAYIDGYAGAGESGIVLASDNETDCINVHFVNLADDYFGFSRFPWLSLKYSCIVRTENGVGYMNTFAHELGHCLGLPHTFNNQFTPVAGNCRTNCFQECVSRTRIQEGYCFFTIGKKKCEVNGDCFCDTDADINNGDDYDEQFASCYNSIYDIYNNNNTLSNCKKFDNYGEQWYSTGFTNAMHNLMSYWDWGCRNEVSKMQRGAMYI